MNKDEIFFDSIKEDRGWYFVQYHPARASDLFAVLNLTTPNTTDKEKVAKAMEAELPIWLKRYPIPIMTSAFDETGDLYDLDGVRSYSHLNGYINSENLNVVLFWRRMENDEFPKIDTSQNRLKEIYKDVSYRTRQDIDKSIKEKSKDIRIFKNILFIWVIGIPAAVTIFLQFSPPWIGWVVFVYGLSKLAYEGLKMEGIIKKSDRQIKKEDEERRKEHHHYHCELNPIGFEKLKVENLENDLREKVQKEAAALKNKSPELPPGSP